MLQMTENIEFEDMTVGCISFVDHFWKKIYIIYDQEQLIWYKNLNWIQYPVYAEKNTHSFCSVKAHPLCGKYC